MCKVLKRWDISLRFYIVTYYLVKPNYAVKLRCNACVYNPQFYKEMTNAIYLFVFIPSYLNIPRVFTIRPNV